MKIYDGLEFTTVDEAIECLPIKAGTSAELLRVAPDAYGPTRPGPPAEPGDPGFQEYPPEPDAKPGTYVRAVWSELSPEAQRDLASAHAAEFAE